LKSANMMHICIESFKFSNLSSSPLSFLFLFYKFHSIWSKRQKAMSYIAPVESVVAMDVFCSHGLGLILIMCRAELSRGLEA